MSPAPHSAGHATPAPTTGFFGPLCRARWTPSTRLHPAQIRSAALRRAPLSHARCADRSCQLDVVLEATVASFLYRCYERRPAEVAGGKRMALVEVSLRKICNAAHCGLRRGGHGAAAEPPCAQPPADRSPGVAPLGGWTIERESQNLQGDGYEARLGRFERRPHVVEHLALLSSQVSLSLTSFPRKFAEHAETEGHDRDASAGDDLDHAADAMTCLPGRGRPPGAARRPGA